MLQVVDSVLKKSTMPKIANESLYDLPVHF